VVIKTNEKVSTNKIKVKSLVQLFKGGGSPEGRAIWSLLPQGETTFTCEIRLLTAEKIKPLADKLKSSKAACTLSSKTCK
jgi:hypothetical protein